MSNHFDVIVVGGGHAGVEAALASARMGAKTLLLTQNLSTVGEMSCNPAIGGIGKGHLVKEIDALDGVMAKAADFAGIQMRTLNARKGPAVRATRAQACRTRYKQYIKQAVDHQENLFLFQQSVDDLIVKAGEVQGVCTQMGLSFFAPAVILTVGTFLGGKIHIGEVKLSGGRAGDAPSIALAQRLRAMPLSVGRLKTGTPPRIDGNTVDFTKMQIQPGDDPRPVFSYLGSPLDHPEQRCCHITHTNERTHEIIRQNLSRSAMYAGEIEGVGPRYCPSIEDKVVRFSDKASHQIFVEPEGLYTTELYPNGLSTSLPFDVQCDYIRSIVGFESAHITRPGYAIEYDYFNPQDLDPTLAVPALPGLFFAGQINGTTGYEEAAAQGLLAGINAAKRAQGSEMVTLRRDQSYIGVMIDDLITNGTQEPYRMFTSRAEYRLLLREDNADRRLTQWGIEQGVVSSERRAAFSEKLADLDHYQKQLADCRVTKDMAKTKGIDLLETTPLKVLLRRPTVSLSQFVDLFENLKTASDNILLQLETDEKYSGYIDRQEQTIDKQRRWENKTIPDNFDYQDISGLSSEMKEKFLRVKPKTVAMAKRIPGVTPAAVALLLVYLKKHMDGVGHG